LFDHRKDIVRIEDLVFLAVEFDFRAAVFADQHAIALLDFEWDFLPIVIRLAGAEGHDQTFHRFFLGGIGNNDSALLDFLLLDGLSTGTRPLLPLAGAWLTFASARFVLGGFVKLGRN